jgi:signal peptidase I
MSRSRLERRRTDATPVLGRTSSSGLLRRLCFVTFAGLCTFGLVRSWLLIVEVKGDSMEPRLVAGDRVLAIRTSARVLAVGDVVVARPPNSNWAWKSALAADSLHQLPKYVVKRVAGLPGYRPPGDPHSTNLRPPVPPNHVYLVGEADASVDSRFWGPVPYSHVVGRVVLRLGRRT